MLKASVSSGSNKMQPESAVGAVRRKSLISLEACFAAALAMSASLTRSAASCPTSSPSGVRIPRRFKRYPTLSAANPLVPMSAVFSLVGTALGVRYWAATNC